MMGKTIGVLGILISLLSIILIITYSFEESKIKKLNEQLTTNQQWTTDTINKLNKACETSYAIRINQSVEFAVSEALRDVQNHLPEICNYYKEVSP